MRPGVPLVGEGYDGDLSMQMSMVMEALTCPGKVLLQYWDAWGPRATVM